MQVKQECVMIEPATYAVKPSVSLEHIVQHTEDTREEEYLLQPGFFPAVISLKALANFGE
jgi:hypothetical protein